MARPLRLSISAPFIMQFVGRTNRQNIFTYDNRRLVIQNSQDFLYMALDEYQTSRLTPLIELPSGEALKHKVTKDPLASGK
jgi:hypothetical protein